MNCLNCNTLTSNPKFCSKSCAATFNNKGVTRNKKIERKCPVCKSSIVGSNRTYCSKQCWKNKLKTKTNQYIQDWKNGKISGLNSNGVVTPQIKQYLRDKFGDKCCICGWNEINPVTKKSPLIADHIDGNWENNVEDNLRLLCPNCESLQPTHGGSNRGNGRGYTKVVKRPRSSNG